jgi:putative membrane protein
MKDRSFARLPLALLLAHLVALVFGVIGLLIMLPNPQLWNEDPLARDIFTWSMDYAGAMHIVLAALTMFVFGVLFVGWAKTTIFFLVSFSLSLTSELIGTGYGWPFGNYAYTDFLGYKVLDRVPYSIPLSWFYMGFASYLLAAALVKRSGWSRQTLWTLLIGAGLLTVWDLVLDPAMAHDDVRVSFWVWDETGPYFGMPLINFVGWGMTGLLFMAISRLLWRSEVRNERVPLFVPFAIYVLNTVWAMILAADVGLWPAIVLAGVLGLIPAWIAIQKRERPTRFELGLAPDA